jgi:hypothetical protein
VLPSGFNLDAVIVPLGDRTAPRCDRRRVALVDTRRDHERPAGRKPALEFIGEMLGRCTATPSPPSEPGRRRSRSYA